MSRFTKGTVHAEGKTPKTPPPKARPEHTCNPPTLPNSGTVAIRPGWECGRCHRVWNPMYGGFGGAWWVEVRGPNE